MSNQLEYLNKKGYMNYLKNRPINFLNNDELLFANDVSLIEENAKQMMFIETGHHDKFDRIYSDEPQLPEVTIYYYYEETMATLIPIGGNINMSLTIVKIAGSDVWNMSYPFLNYEEANILLSSGLEMRCILPSGEIMMFKNKKITIMSSDMKDKHIFG